MGEKEVRSGIHEMGEEVLKNRQVGGSTWQTLTRDEPRVVSQ